MSGKYDPRNKGQLLTNNPRIETTVELMVAAAEAQLLNFAAIPEDEIVSACERFNLDLETWRRQEQALKLMRKVYEKRAIIRGEHRPTASW